MTRRTARTAVKLATVLSLTLGAGLAAGQPAFAYCPACSHPGQFHDEPQEQKPRTTGDKVHEGIEIALGVLGGLTITPEFGGVEGVGVGEAGARGGDEAGGERGGPSRSGGTRDESPQRPTKPDGAQKPTTGTGAAKPEAGRPEEKFVEADRGPGYGIVTEGDTASGQPTKVPESGMELDFQTLDLNSQKPADGVTRIRTGRTKLAEDDPNYDSDSDDFDEAYRGRIPKPTSQSEVAKAVASGADRTVILWRGTGLKAAESMAKQGSASGDPASAATARPSAATAAQQVGKGGVLPEFTTDPGVAEGFSHKNALVVIEISAKYLAKGSSSESGWVAARTAPAKVRVIVDRTGGAGGSGGPNAS
ncbi:DUF4765 family protein [Streptomyces sp. BE20]|uniref:DUF4765 family protein n=1 Tax=unclassified Streptomyces TaxID=2593676 RepID=UPI002E7834E5|nr:MULTISPECIES: DUF4765 family protein [unclassified Streptomyces]MED7952283.1 DUF4765 family protein [Streptomyces sp. BE303]MEE1824139.1 DUF4765 family protein [Streptomyces sp. BE20]